MIVIFFFNAVIAYRLLFVHLPQISSISHKVVFNKQNARFELIRPMQCDWEVPIRIRNNNGEFHECTVIYYQIVPLASLPNVKFHF